MSAFVIQTAVHATSLLGSARRRRDDATHDAATSDTAVATLQQAVDETTAELARLEATDASGELDQSHELRIFQLRRALPQQQAQLDQAQRNAERLHRLQTTAADETHRIEAELWKREHDLNILRDITHNDVQHMTIAEYRHQLSVHYSEIQRLAGQ